MTKGVIDFSKWNTMPWWNQNGYKTRDEAWADYGRCQRLFATNVQHSQADVNVINEAARKSEGKQHG